ncbi:hypothetical protein GQ42DRAFT_161487 [Ramicandelaber brevisporus]|nr:hypothetical protein GQ42DRAFT_161487 [Ramicandelaber brevisporus]
MFYATTSSDAAADVSESMATSANETKKKRDRESNFTENSICIPSRAAELVKQLGLQAKTDDVEPRIKRVKSWFSNFRNSKEGKMLLAASNAHAE